MLKQWLNNWAVKRVVHNNLIKFPTSHAQGIVIDGDVTLTSGSIMTRCRVNGSVIVDGVNIVITENYVTGKLKHVNS